MKDCLERLCALCGRPSVKTNEPMRKHTTFRAGGPARYFVSPKSEDSLKNLVQFCRREELPCYILGNGSNLLVSDEGYDGVMILIGNEFSYTQTAKDFSLGSQAFAEADGSDGSVLLRAGAGTRLSRVANTALTQCMTGFEFAAGIPGTLGGAVVMNAGAYGSEMKDVLRLVRVLTKEGEILEFTADQIGLDYRKSRIAGEGWIVLSACIGLRPGDQAAVRSLMDELAGRRKAKQPLEFPSAGSTFKRPKGHYAGKLIEDAGLRGFSVGEAQVSEKHCGFLINRGGASASEIRELIFQVQRRVKEHSGVDLEPEVKLIGWED